MFKKGKLPCLITSKAFFQWAIFQCVSLLSLLEGILRVSWVKRWSGRVFPANGHGDASRYPRYPRYPRYLTTDFLNTDWRVDMSWCSTPRSPWFGSIDKAKGGWNDRTQPLITFPTQLRYTRTLGKLVWEAPCGNSWKCRSHHWRVLRIMECFWGSAAGSQFALPSPFGILKPGQTALQKFPARFDYLYLGVSWNRVIHFNGISVINHLFGGTPMAMEKW